MFERTIHMSYNITDPTEAAAVGAAELHEYIPIGLSIISVSIAPKTDDAGATLDIQIDGTDIITAIDASDADVPGTWLSTAVGGTNTPVSVAAGAEMSFDFNSAAIANRFDIAIIALIGETIA